MSAVQQVEIVKPSRPLPEALGELIGSFAWFAVRVLIIWWGVAVWFPEYGLTYWQLILPVYAIRALILPKLTVRQLSGK